MKKLSLNKINLTSLDKSQMSNVNGGIRALTNGRICVSIETVDCDSAVCTQDCPTAVTCPSVTCPTVDCVTLNNCDLSRYICIGE